ncbi:MAG TPA: hypothetical protein VMV69_10500 [Pirellulales bacterium]|nr:hypothetical protein [Pirellulales bacterium]
MSQQTRTYRASYPGEAFAFLASPTGSRTNDGRLTNRFRRQHRFRPAPALVSLLALYVAFGQNSAAYGLTDDDIRHSEWKTEYEALGGGQVKATLVLDGAEGHYDTADGSGQLSEVKYKFNLTGGATIKGNWSFGGSDGTFIFFLAGNSFTPIFSGSWQADGRSGNWSGRFSGVVQSGGGDGGSDGRAGAVSYDDTWSYNDAKSYYYKTCRFPAGGYQYVIYFKSKPD